MKKCYSDFWVNIEKCFEFAGILFLSFLIFEKYIYKKFEFI